MSLGQESWLRCNNLEKERNEMRARSNQNNLDLPMKRCVLGSTITKGYRLKGSVRASQSRGTTVSPPAGFGSISRFGWGLPLLPVSPPMTRIDPLGSIAAVGYHRPRYRIINDCITLEPEWFNPPEDWGSCSFLPNRWCRWLQENHRAYIGEVRMSIARTIHQYWWDGQPCQAGQYFRSRTHRFWCAFRAMHERNHRPR